LRRAAGFQLVECEALRRAALHCGPQAMEGIGLRFGCVALLATAVASNHEEIVAVPPAGHSGVGVFPGGGLVDEHEAAVDCGPLGLVDGGGISVGQVTVRGVPERDHQPLIVVGEGRCAGGRRRRGRRWLGSR
jgi:hypothetical protein